MGYEGVEFAGYYNRIAEELRKMLDDLVLKVAGTHMSAEVKWNRYTEKIWCTMHDGMYDPKTGRPFMGMPRESLKKIELKIEDNGDICHPIARTINPKK
jgi:hypothetical protein